MIFFPIFSCTSRVLFIDSDPTSWGWICGHYLFAILLLRKTNRLTCTLLVLQINPASIWDGYEWCTAYSARSHLNKAKQSVVADRKADRAICQPDDSIVRVCLCVCVWSLPYEHNNNTHSLLSFITIEPRESMIWLGRVCVFFFLIISISYGQVALKSSSMLRYSSRWSPRDQRVYALFWD